MTSLSRRLGAEAVGTALLVATVIGSGMMAEALTRDAGLALLANTLATGAILYVLIGVLAPVSGAHFNPAVSLVMGFRGELGWRLVLAYVAAQLGGGLVGTMLAHAMFDAPLFVPGDQMRSGTGQWLSEGVAAFGLVLTILLGARHRPQALPALVGCYIVAAYWFTASTSFANPAVTIARSLTDTFAGIRPLDAPAFIAAELAGAVLALGVSRWLEGSERAA